MIKFDPVKNRIFTDTRNVGIGHREGLILELLVQRAPDVIEKQEIITHAWGNICVGDTSLAKSISALRQAFLKLGVKESPIITAPRVGYRALPGRVKCVEISLEDVVENPLSTETPNPHEKLDTESTEQQDTSNCSDLSPTCPPYIRIILNTLSVILIFATLAILSIKLDLAPWPPHAAHLALTQQRVGELILIKSPSVKLSLPLRRLLASNQCDCVVFVGIGDGENELAWFHRQTQDAVNLTYRSGQFPVVSAQITQFVEERK
ncbi:winged helix-turn-helix domain-containing protein [Grimontia marina]|uniref:DNA-binding transcriptional activator CadC n=1 Tax=Grimontia marina TaxID=646534 RepID=A0A128FJ89_9GAMM|nr:winged helix-turn-helix domain-containing protein [Grimontia marina]CZF86374.1 DNA-binding transcriptional activator CadC [Grimontia marina]